MVKLQICPFCGGDNVEYKSYLADGWMECVRCGTKGPISFLAETDEEAARNDALNKWNHRTVLELKQVD